MSRGSIEVDTLPGEFTEIRITLPRSAAFITESQGRTQFSGSWLWRGSHNSPARDWPLLGIALIASESNGQVQAAAAPPFATKYFLDAPPTQDDLAKLPPEARDVIVAKIRIFKGVWLGMRDQAGRPPPLPKNIYLAKIELLDVLGGSAKSGDQLDVFIATTATVRRYMTPSTPAMKARDYFVATFADSENQRRLLGLPGSQVEFERWQAELSKDSSSTMEHQK